MILCRVQTCPTKLESAEEHSTGFCRSCLAKMRAGEIGMEAKASSAPFEMKINETKVNGFPIPETSKHAVTFFFPGAKTGTVAK